MNHEHSHGDRLKRRWDEDDAARDKSERRARQSFLEQQASQTFAPIENYLIRLAKTLRLIWASVETDASWEHLSDQKLRRATKVMPSGSRKSFGSISPFKAQVLSTAIRLASFRGDGSAHFPHYFRGGAVLDLLRSQPELVLKMYLPEANQSLNLS